MAGEACIRDNVRLGGHRKDLPGLHKDFFLMQDGSRIVVLFQPYAWDGMSEMQVGGAFMSLAFCFLLFPSVFLLLPSASLLLFTTRGWMLVTGATGSG